MITQKEQEKNIDKQKRIYFQKCIGFLKIFYYISK